VKRRVSWGKAKAKIGAVAPEYKQCGYYTLDEDKAICKYSDIFVLICDMPEEKPIYQSTIHFCVGGKFNTENPLESTGNF
jgi:hypothetical protein